jgi:hypothetical protein
LTTYNDVVIKRLFSFPNPVNDVAARTVAAGVTIMVITAIATQQLWLTIPLAYGFVARVLTGPTMSPLGQIATRVVAPRLAAHAKLVPGPPKRFAQAMGATFTITALILWLSGQATGASIVLGFMTLPAVAEAGFGYCIGCQIFARLMRAGVIPESVCEECGNIYSANASLRRAGVVQHS